MNKNIFIYILLTALSPFAAQAQIFVADPLNSCAMVRWREHDRRMKDIDSQVKQSSSVEDLVRLWNKKAQDTQQVAEKTKSGQYSMDIEGGSPVCPQ